MWGLDPLLAGTVCAMLASLLYTGASICQRFLIDVDPFWTQSVKALPTVVICAPVFARYWLRQGRMPAARLWLMLIVTGLIVQLAGNVAFQWSLGVVGLAMSVPLCFGTLIVSGAMLGRIWLGESISMRSALAMLLLIGSIAVLASGASAAHRQLDASGSNAAHQESIGLLVLGVGAACISGVAYALQGAVIRRVIGPAAPMSMVLLVLSGTGFVALGLASLYRMGWERMLDTPHDKLWLMVCQGVFNAVGFFALSKSLQLVPIVHVNVANASQIALASIAGVAFFNEKFTWHLAAGTSLTILGLFLVDRRRRTRQAMDASTTRPVDEPCPQEAVSPTVMPQPAQPSTEET